MAGTNGQATVERLDAGREVDQTLRRRLPVGGEAGPVDPKVALRAGSIAGAGAVRIDAGPGGCGPIARKPRDVEAVIAEVGVRARVTAGVHHGRLRVAQVAQRKVGGVVGLVLGIQVAVPVVAEQDSAIGRRVVVNLGVNGGVDGPRWPMQFGTG